MFKSKTLRSNTGKIMIRLTTLFLFLFTFTLLHSLPSPSIQELEKDILKKVNAYRKQKKKPQLKHDPIISTICRKHAEEMANGSAAFSHDGSKQRFEQICNHISKVSKGAENLHMNKGYDDPAARAVEGWIHSPSHHEAIVGEYEITGVGGAKSDDGRFYFNQFFVHINKSRSK